MPARQNVPRLKALCLSGEISIGFSHDLRWGWSQEAWGWIGHMTTILFLSSARPCAFDLEKFCIMRRLVKLLGQQLLLGVIAVSGDLLC